METNVDQAQQIPINSSKLPWVLVTILTIVLLTFITWYFWDKNKTQQTLTTISPTQMVSVKPLISPSISEPQQVTTSPTQIPYSTINKLNWKKFERFEISFLYPEYLNIASQNDNEVIWNGQLTKDNIKTNAMIFHTQNTPFQEIKEGQPFNVSNNLKVTVNKVSIDNSRPALEGVNGVVYNVSCGVDCEFGIVRFQYQLTYHELIFDIAGGGLDRQFEEIISSLQFFSP